MNRFFTILGAAVLVLALLAAGAAAAPTHGWSSTPRVVTTFAAGDYGSFAEGMAADSHGDLWVSVTDWGLYDDSVDPPVMTSDIGQIWKVTPRGKATRMATMDLSPYGFFLGVAVRDDRIYVAMSDQGAGAITTGVYRLGAGGKLRLVVALPEGAWPNGLAFHGRRLYITDSGMGAVWRARVGAGKVTLTEPWAQDDLLMPGDPSADETMSGIGVNGIAFRGDRMFVSVADYGRLVRIPVRADGSPGTPVVVCEDKRLRTADGIAFDRFGGLWVTTDAGTTDASPTGGLYRLTPGAGLWTIADDPGWLNYPTMPVFGTTPATRCTLFVENGAFHSYEGDGTAPDIQALRVAVPGLPLF
jgi:sugar lactone lactonase YvrE